MLIINLIRFAIPFYPIFYLDLLVATPFLFHFYFFDYLNAHYCHSCCNSNIWITSTQLIPYTMMNHGMNENFSDLSNYAKMFSLNLRLLHMTLNYLLSSFSSQTFVTTIHFKTFKTLKLYYLYLSSFKVFSHFSNIAKYLFE